MKCLASFLCRKFCFKCMMVMIKCVKGMSVINKLIIISLVLLLFISLCACNGSESVTKISDIAYGKSTDNTVYILENEHYVPFLVLTNDYYGDTLLLRRDVKSPGRFNEYSSFYENSEIDHYLNHGYLEEISSALPHIQLTNLDVTDEKALGKSGTETKTIKRNVFLLSCTEIGIDSVVNMGDEGLCLSYFSESENRIAYRDGSVSSWWLRTPNTYYRSCVYVVGDNNKIGFSNAYDNNGIRPAFCVKNDSKIELKDGIVDNQMVYVFSGEN